jgi:hypothetical protein
VTVTYITIKKPSRESTGVILRPIIRPHLHLDPHLLRRRSALPPPEGQSETKETKIIYGEESDEFSDEDEGEYDDGEADWEDELIFFPGADGGMYQSLYGKVYFVGYLI